MELLAGIIEVQSGGDGHFQGSGNSVFNLDKKEKTEEISLILCGVIMYSGALVALILNTYQFW